MTAVQVYNLHMTVMHLGSKRKPKFRTLNDFHPYKKRQRRGLRITPDNFNVLRQIGNALMRDKR